jgi:hypothetical protein
MKKALSVSALVVAVILIFSCNKSSSSSGYPSFGPTSLWPLQQGNSWYYKDSTFTDSTGFQATFLDTITTTSQVLQDPSGLFFVGINESSPYGWFGSSGYVSVDPYNTTIYQLDSVNSSPYIFFGTVAQDGTQIGTGTDFTNTTCPLNSTLYGFVTPVTVNGYSCIKNIEYNVTTCNNITQEIVVTYVSPGVGIVRIEDYEANPNNNNQPFLDYSQTLQSSVIK